MEFATKPDLARQMLGRALDAGVPAGWVTADEAYGQDAQVPDLAGATPDRLRRRRAQEPGRRVGRHQRPPRGRRGGARPGQAWKRRSAAMAPRAPGSMTGRWPPCPAPTTAWPPGCPGGCWSAAALPATTKASWSWPITCATAPPEPPIEHLVRVAGSRWAIEECFQTAKTEAGLDQYQVRRYDAWHRHVTLAMLAHAYLAVTAANAPKALAAASSPSRSVRSAVSWHT